MKKVYIVGAGGFGRELLQWAGQHPDCGHEWEIAGFIDDNPDALNGFAHAEKIVSSVRDFLPKEGELLLMAIGAPKGKKAVAEALLARGAEFLTFVHPTAIIGKNVALGRGTVICPRCVLTTDQSIGDFAMYNLFCASGHDVKIGDYVTLSSFCDITGHVTLEEGVFCGSRVSVIPGKRVGAWATVGAGSVVVSNVAPGATVFGNPAKRIA
jgi:sugar O-acyltransferase (sialic acid O-acetyltransferase NeuD family)